MQMFQCDLSEPKPIDKRLFGRGDAYMYVATLILNPRAVQIILLDYNNHLITIYNRNTNRVEDVLKLSYPTCISEQQLILGSVNQPGKLYPGIVCMC